MIETVDSEKQKIWDSLSQVLDPEIPVLNIAELGVLRAVEIEQNQVIVVITPTYSGCPAMKLIEDQIVSVLTDNGYTNIKVKTILSPAWTTDWLTDEAKQKLLEYGIAPPGKASVNKQLLFSEGLKKVACPQCGSENTEMKSQFGSTACKALYVCKDCLEPFDYFKCL